MASLAEDHCSACSAGAESLSPSEITAHCAHVPQWQLIADGKAIMRRWTFKNYAAALEFVQQFSIIAEQENHHPDVAFGWGYVEVTLTTHSAGGLHINDFIVAAKIDVLAAS